MTAAGPRRAADVNSKWPARDGSAFGASTRPVRDMNLGVSTHHVNLTPQESSLIGESHPEALTRMDEKALKDLQSRLRQAREKNFNLLRRQGAARVATEGARGSAQPASEKRGEKVEIFDEALVRVSERLGAIGGSE
ncbi:hypothetical protein MTY59_45150 [Mycobacterium senriense]|uniref:Uncharacterized protein n=1 Tax=Mycobacterium senriense TaxID=2775496 RepID=A0ABN6IQ22_9MYCO|nr:hypothetical protein MTY59_45150 [Mycobacterium senriense]